MKKLLSSICVLIIILLSGCAEENNSNACTSKDVKDRGITKIAVSKFAEVYVPLCSGPIKIKPILLGREFNILQNAVSRIETLNEIIVDSLPDDKVKREITEDYRVIKIKRNDKLYPWAITVLLLKDFGLNSQIVKE